MPNEIIDLDKLLVRPYATQGDVDALRSDVVQLRIRLDRLATNAELAGFHGLNLAALLTQSLVHVSAIDTPDAHKLTAGIRAALGVE